MKRFLFGFLAILFLILNTIPYLHIMADSSMTDAQYKQVGAFALSSLITTGEATELDFNDYTSSDTDFLFALGELIVTGDPTGLVECGLEWLGGTIDDAYNSAIQSIRTWEYNNLPDSFYYWFIDENPPYELGPSYNNIRYLSQPLRRLLTPPDDSDPSPVPNEYRYLVNQICSWEVNNIDISNLPLKGVSGLDSISFTQNMSDFCMITQFSSDYQFMPTWKQSGRWYTSTIGDINITSNGDSTYNVAFSNFSNYAVMRGLTSYPNYANLGVAQYMYIQNVSGTNYLSFQIINSSWVFPDLDGGNIGRSLTSLLNSLAKQFRHCNLYVDGVQWGYVGDSPSYPIVIPGQLTIWNDQPLQYEFPSDTYLKLPDLTTIITNAINNSGVVMWSDIADCFVDVNGQTAVAVTKIVRNDYDNLYIEQYPYPAMLVGMTDQTKFNEHLLDNSHAYLSPMGTVVQETVNVLPSELVGVLAIGAILTIFAVIINRLLE